MPSALLVAYDQIEPSTVIASLAVAVEVPTPADAIDDVCTAEMRGIDGNIDVHLESGIDRDDAEAVDKLRLFDTQPGRSTKYSVYHLMSSQGCRWYSSVLAGASGFAAASLTALSMSTSPYCTNSS